MEMEGMSNEKKSEGYRQIPDDFTHKQNQNKTKQNQKRTDRTKPEIWLKNWGYYKGEGSGWGEGLGEWWEGTVVLW